MRNRIDELCVECLIGWLIIGATFIILAELL